MKSISSLCYIIPALFLLFKNAYAFSPTAFEPKSYGIFQKPYPYHNHPGHGTNSFTPMESKATKLNMGLWDFNNDDGTVKGSDRVLSCLPYLIPLLDGDHFGYFIYQRIPPLYYISHVLIAPIEGIYNAVPFASILAFFALLAITQNSNISSSIRFNAQQALLIDVALIFPEILGSTLPKTLFPRIVVEPCTNFIFYTLVAMLAYSIVSNLAGKKPNQIPIISDAAQSAIGPF